ncbi:DoxX family protein [Phyllobacterium sp. SB3]|uniref:DoxX family protein n=1 Tax=Phyllobacterium sp. SB3 TaxID=3156073 RepID=UPI0032AEB766
MLLKIEKHSPASKIMRFVAYLGLCAAYLQGGLVKLSDFPGAIAEMTHFGLTPPPLFAVLVIVFEIVASVMILTGFLRWLAALALGGFTLLATLIALRFWEMPAGHERFMAANSFFEHLGLVGGFILIAWLDLTEKTSHTVKQNQRRWHDADPTGHS